MIYATNNSCVEEEVFFSGLVALKIFRGYLASGRRDTWDRVRYPASLVFRRTSRAGLGLGRA